jgi:hypothetical protein
MWSCVRRYQRSARRLNARRDSLRLQCRSFRAHPRWGASASGLPLQANLCQLENRRQHLGSTLHPAKPAHQKCKYQQRHQTAIGLYWRGQWHHRDRLTWYPLPDWTGPKCKVWRD